VGIPPVPPNAGFMSGITFQLNFIISIVSALAVLPAVETPRHAGVSIAPHPLNSPRCRWGFQHNVFGSVSVRYKPSADSFVRARLVQAVPRTLINAPSEPAGLRRRGGARAARPCVWGSLAMCPCPLSSVGARLAP